MVGHGGSSAGSYLADPTSPIPSHCASIVPTCTARVELNASFFSDEQIPTGYSVMKDAELMSQLPDHHIRHNGISAFIRVSEAIHF